MDRSFKQNKVIIIVTDILIMVFATFTFLYAKIKYCYGEFRFYMPLSFCLGIYLQQISINNLVEKILNMIYNFIVKIFCKLKKTKLLGKILKWVMDKSKAISIIIKTTICILFAVIFVVLLSQYITIAQLNKKNESLNTELSTITKQQEELTKQYNDINNNYEDYVEDYMRDKYDYVKDDQVLINKD